MISMQADPFEFRFALPSTALLIIEQQVSHALALADRVAVLDHGTVAWTGDSKAATAIVHQAFEPVA